MLISHVFVYDKLKVFVLGVVSNRKTEWLQALGYLAASSLERLNAPKRIAHIEVGNEPTSMLKLHSALVLGRVLAKCQ